jgi:release factor glutamine methyltransferase
MDQALILEIAKKLNYPTPLPIAKEIVEFTDGRKKDIDEILKRISKDEPWEYIRGYTYFLGHKIYVNQNVLIPRKETEELVTIALEEIKELGKVKKQIIDVGTGSGCIAIALKKALGQEIIAIDTSLEAIKVARKNSRENSCEDLQFHNSDFENLEISNTLVTIIVANLPYIPSEDINFLENSVKNYEPIEALDGGHDGAKHYCKLLNDIQKKDINFEIAIFEIDTSMEKSLIEMLDSTEEYNYVVMNDSFNRKRFLKVEKL